MTTNVAAMNNQVEYTSPTRRRVTGILFLVLAALIWFLFSRGLDPEAATKFGLVPGGSGQELPDWVFTTLPMLNVMAGLSALIGGYQLARGFGKRTNLMIGLVAAFFIFAFLTWATSGGSLPLASGVHTSPPSPHHSHTHRSRPAVHLGVAQPVGHH